MDSGPAALFENILDIDQLAGVVGDVEANRVGCGALRELFAAMVSKSDVAHLAHTRLIGLEGASGRPALTPESVA